MKALSNDELRETITKIKGELKAATEADTTAIAELKAKIEELPFDERQPLWDDILSGHAAICCRKVYLK